jgi:polysaccharide export outer membrane protein
MKTHLKSPALCLLLAVFLHAFTPHLRADGAGLRVGDILEIRLAGVPSEEMVQFSAPYTVDDAGSVNLPYIGLVKVAGLPVNQAQLAIESKLQQDKIYTHPTVTINIPNASRFVSVGGQVRAPGRIPYSADLTLMSAINAAGGFNDYADRKRVRMVREKQAQVIDTRKLVKNPDQDPKILPGDQIEVPQSLW